MRICAVSLPELRIEVAGAFRSTLANEALPVAIELASDLSIPVQLVRVINPTLSRYPATRSA